MAIKFRQGSRKQLWLRMMVQGPAKSGKSFTSLRIAHALAKPEKVAIIEAGERGATEKYCNETIDGVQWTMPMLCTLDDYSPETYTEAVLEAARQGAEVIVLDSLTHEWIGKGGALEIANQNGNFTGWKTATPLHDRLFETLLSVPAHVIATVRSKMDYVVEPDPEKPGKTRPVRVGMAPIQRDTVEYEFDLILAMDESHIGHVRGSRCRAVDGKTFLKPGPEFITPVVEWLREGTRDEIATGATARIEDGQIQRVSQLLNELRWTMDRLTKLFPSRYGCTSLDKLTHEQAANLIKWMEGQKKGTKQDEARAAAKAQQQKADPEPDAPPPAAAPAPSSPPHPAPTGGARATPEQVAQIKDMYGEWAVHKAEHFAAQGKSADDAEAAVLSFWATSMLPKGRQKLGELTRSEAIELANNLKREIGHFQTIDQMDAQIRGRPIPHQDGEKGEPATAEAAAAKS